MKINRILWLVVAFVVSVILAPILPLVTHALAGLQNGTWPAASSGFVATSRSPGIPAARRRGRSPAHRSGTYTSKTAQARPLVVTYAENTVVAQFSTFPVHPACCGAAQAVSSPCLSCNTDIDPWQLTPIPNARRV